MSGERAVWYVREGALPGGLLRITARTGPRHPDGAVVDDPEADEAVVWQSLPSDWGLVRIDWPAAATPGAPDLWFVHVDEPRASPPGTNLVAFATDTFPRGTIVSKYTFATAGVPNDRQAGAVRWYPGTAIVHQIFVAKPFRRSSVGTALLHAADGFHQANGWPGHLHSDGRRTDLGQQFSAGVRHPQRFAPLTETMPAMDPD